MIYPVDSAIHLLINRGLFISQHYRYVLCDYRGGSRIFLRRAVPDPDLEMVVVVVVVGGGGSVGGLQKIYFGLKIRGGSEPPGPLPWIRHWRGCTTKEWREGGAHTLHPPS